MSARLFTVKYAHGHTGTGQHTQVVAKVAAYSAQDAVFQVLLLPKNYAAANAPWCWARAVSCAPYREGDKIDRDVTREG